MIVPFPLDITPNDVMVDILDAGPAAERDYEPGKFQIFFQESREKL